MNQGADDEKETERVLTGARELRILLRPLLYMFTRSLGLVDGSGLRVVLILDLKISMSIAFRFLNEIVLGSFIADRERETLNVMSWWSVMGRESEVNLLGVSPEQQTKSRM